MIRPLHHMGIGEQQALGIEDHSTALAALHPGARGCGAGDAEELAKQRVLHQGRRHTRNTGLIDGPRRLQADHCRTTALHSGSHKRAATDLRARLGLLRANDQGKRRHAGHQQSPRQSRGDKRAGRGVDHSFRAIGCLDATQSRSKNSHVPCQSCDHMRPGSR